MNDVVSYQQSIASNGFTVIDKVYTADEMKAIIASISQADQSSASFRKTDDVFAIRRLLKEVPLALPLVLTDKLKVIIRALFDDKYFVVKSIYFDKPESSNWFVTWHQDLTIAVDNRAEVEGFGPWTVKQGQFGVQPPLNVLQNNFTIRIHLDDTDGDNGALKVIPGSHLSGVNRVENIDWNAETEATCNVKAGGIMIMRPLLMHSSSRTTNNKKRRVVHIEFSKAILPQEISWAEKEDVKD